MSEFSDSYHLWNSTVDAAVRLARTVGRYALVIPPIGRNVPFFIEGIDEVGGPMDVVLEHNPGILVHYAFGDDHGCWIRVFERADALAILSFVRPGDRRPDQRPTSINAENMAPALAVLIEHGVIGVDIATRLEEISRTAAVSASGPLVAAALELEHVDWTSCGDLTYRSQRKLREQWPDARFVHAKQRGKAKGSASLEEIMALPVPEFDLNVAQERMLERHFKYWTEFGDWDDVAQQGYWMYEHYESLLPSRYRYLPIQLMNYNYRDMERLRQVLRAILGLCGVRDWEPLLRGF